LKMKKLIVALSASLLVAVVALAENNAIKTFSYHSSTALTASGTSELQTYDLNAIKPEGYFSLQYTITGDGTVKFEYYLSNDGSTFVEPSTASDIGSGLTSGSGLLQFEPEPARFMKIRATETGGASAATVTTVLMIQ